MSEFVKLSGEIIAAAGGTKLAYDVLGPTAKLLGVGLRDHTEQRAKKFGRILQTAYKRLGDRIKEEGAVPPRVLKEVVDTGTLYEDEIAAEYYGGVLASSRSGVSRDDRGAVLLERIKRLSSYQLRSHYIFYVVVRSLYMRVAGSSIQTQPDDLTIFIPMREYLESMEMRQNENEGVLVAHVLAGLGSEDLIGKHISGSVKFLRERLKGSGNNFAEEVSEPGLITRPTLLGAELFLWTLGLPNINIDRLIDPDLPIEPNVEISIPENAKASGPIRGL